MINLKSQKRLLYYYVINTIKYFLNLINKLRQNKNWYNEIKILDKKNTIIYWQLKFQRIKLIKNIFLVLIQINKNFGTKYYINNFGVKNGK